MAGAQEARDGNGSRGGGPGPQRRARRVLVFPLPFQGHIDPMLHLAGVLHARGLAVTVLHTRWTRRGTRSSGSWPSPTARPPTSPPRGGSSTSSSP
ncbi:unnamed protein product [Miscanthus lutarioriparius]|uniref:Glucosyltransferase n=1 Tax=Miscanthus lutarioriparius TaxID=422564 RepID=A0A811NDZ2_9POAL|nr:unnamed protein product [Miscanthus lutarioriparius]